MKLYVLLLTRKNAFIYKFKIMLNFHKWPRQNFSIQYQYNIKQTSDENKEQLYQLGEY